MSRRALTILFSLTLSSQALSQSASEVEALCLAAETARQQAAVSRYEWTTIGPLLARAGAATAEGDYDSAAKLCQEAKLQAELALQQAQREADNWRDSIPL